MAWAVVGVARIAERQRRWWWMPEHGILVSLAIHANNPKEYRALTSHVRKIRGERGIVIGGEAFGLLLLIVLMLTYSPWWGWAVLAAVAVPLLARAGRPAHMPIITPSMTTPRRRVISADKILPVELRPAGRNPRQRRAACALRPARHGDHSGACRREGPEGEAALVADAGLRGRGVAPLPRQ